MTKNEIIVKHINTYDKECIGCKKHEKDVMVSCSDEENGIVDLFLSEDMALQLMARIGKILDLNDPTRES